MNFTLNCLYLEITNPDKAVVSLGGHTYAVAPENGDVTVEHRLKEMKFNYYQRVLLCGLT